MQLLNLLLHQAAHFIEVGPLCRILSPALSDDTRNGTVTEGHIARCTHVLLSFLARVARRRVLLGHRVIDLVDAVRSIELTGQLLK